MEGYCTEDYLAELVDNLEKENEELKKIIEVKNNKIKKLKRLLKRRKK